MSEVLAKLEKKGGAMSETVLWTNPNPSSAFSIQNITLPQSITDFEYIKFVYRISTGNSKTCAVIMSVDDFINTNISTNRLTMEAYLSSAHYARMVNYNSPTSINIEGAYRINASGNTDAGAIPQEIIGLR